MYLLLHKQLSVCQKSTQLLDLRGSQAGVLHLEPLVTKVCIDPRCYFKNWSLIHL